MELTPQIFRADVMHKRLLPKVNAFRYGVYYLAFPLSKLSTLADGCRFGVNQVGILSFFEKDHGARSDEDLEHWAREILNDAGLSLDGEIMLISLPRVLGYVFNPVSFWFCFDAQKQLRAVIAEVNNTFGETHSYVCFHDDHRPIAKDDWLHARKLFHVSPFIEREGSYQFRFALEAEKLGIWIDYYNAEGDKQLLTALTGKLEPYTRQSRRAAFWAHPLVTLKTIALIHWQALKLVSKGIRYIPKPEQKQQRVSQTDKP